LDPSVPSERASLFLGAALEIPEIVSEPVSKIVECSVLSTFPEIINMKYEERNKKKEEFFFGTNCFSLL